MKGEGMKACIQKKKIHSKLVYKKKKKEIPKS